MSFLLRRGLDSDRLTITPLEGEIIYTTDTKLVYIGDGVTVGGVEVGVVPEFTTNDIPEQGNLYYTNSRVYANVIGLVNVKANVTDLNTSNIVEGSNLYYTNARVYSNVIALLNSKANNVDLTTSNVVEGSNLYFTNTRAVSAFNVGQNLNIDANGLITTTKNQVIEGNLTIQGNILIMGNVAKIDVQNFSVTDNMIYLNSNSTIANPDIGLVANYNDGTYHHTGLFRDATDGNWKFFENYLPEPDASPYIDTGHSSFRLANVQANVFFGSGLGLTNIPASSITGNTDSIAEGVVNLYYKDSRAYANINPLLNLKANTTDLTSANVAELTNLYYTNSRVYSNVIGLLSSKVDSASQTTANTTEVTNLYYTNARVYSNVIGIVGGKANRADLNTSNIVEGSNLYYTDARVDAYFKPFLNTTYFVEGPNLFYTDARVEAYVRPLLNTTYFVEGPNLFYTNARVYSNVIGLINAKVNTTSLTTANVSELTNLYYTNARVYSNVIGLLNAKANTADLNTSNITEGNKLFYTDNRVYANVIGLLNAKANTLDLTTNNVSEGGNLYYTNARVYSNVIGLVSVKANTADLTTANTTEVTNLYYTNARVYSNVIALLNTKVNTVSLTTANTTEVTNLYFTNTRAISALTSGQNISIASNGLITGSVSSFTGNTNAVPEGSANLYYTNARVYSNVIGLINAKANTADLNTGNIVEGSNLYFTNTRAVSAFTAGQNLSIAANGLITGSSQPFTGNTDAVPESLSNLYYTNARVYANVIGLLNAKANTADLNSSNIVEGTKLFYTNARVYSNVIALLNAKVNTVSLTTANTTEVTNLYFTNTRAISALTAGQNLSIAANGLIGTTNNQTVSGNLTVQGNLIVTGNITTVSVQNFSVTDNMIYLNANSTVANPDIGFAANYNDGAYHHTGLFRDATDGRWKFFDNYDPEPDASAYIDTANATFRLANVQAGTFFGSGIGLTGIPATAFTGNTDSIAEGVVNLYYTNTRVYSNVIGLLNAKANTNDLTTANTTEVTNLYYTNTRVYSNVIGLLNSKVNTTSLTTANTTEVTNLYYTNARVYSNVIGLLNSKVNTTSLTTANTTEVTNLYYTNARVYSNVIGLITVKANTADLNTSNVVEGSNLYFTNTRVVSALTSGQNISIAANGLITAATGTAFTGNTNAVPEGSANLYFTNTRAISALTSGQNISIAANGLITGASGTTFTGNTNAVPEGTANLYFTNTRAISALTAGSGVIIAANGRITSNVLTVLNSQSFPGGNVNATLLTAVTHPKQILVTVDGLLLIPLIDYTVSGSTITFIGTPSANSTIEVKYYGNDAITVFNNNILSILTSQNFAGGASTITLATSVANPAQILVSVDGLLQIPTLDYTVSGTILTFTSVPPANSVIEVKYYGTDAVLRSYTPVVLNDISPYFNGVSMVFNLRQDQDTINTIADSKDLEVIIGGRRLTPYLTQLTYPWLTPYDSFKGFKVSGSQIIIYSAPAVGTESSLIYRPVSSAKQKKKYPYSATTIALGD